MLQHKRIDISEGIDSNKTSASKECMLCRYRYFENIGFKFESNVCNKYHGVLMTSYKLKNIAVLNVKGIDYRCILWSVSKNDKINILNNSMLIETPIEIIKGGAFGGTFVRGIYSGVNGKWFRNL